jgi:hypothetical protein
MTEPAKHDGEERVAPGRLYECTRIRQKWRDSGLAARRMVAIDEVAERIEAYMLAEGHSERESPGIETEPAPEFMKHKPEDGAVRGMDRQSSNAPTRSPRHRLAQEGNIGVVAA